MTEPVVLGSSATGILISLALSRAGIRHVWIGSDEPPPAIPRLGESIIDSSSPELWRLYGHEFADCFHKKSHISYFNGNFSAVVHLASPVRSKARIDKFAPPDGRKTRYPWFGEALFHLDRIKFDRAAYHKARAQESCRFVAARVTRLVMDGDRVARVELDDGSALDQPRYLFDATGFRSLVADAAGVGLQPTSTPQRVVWTHYRRPAAEPNPPEWWRHGTNLMRLDRAFDGIDAMAWLIPLGDTLSVGMSLDDDDSPHAGDDAAALMDRLAAAFKNRALDFEPIYPDRQPIQEMRHRYFVRDRAWGPNWLLVGPTFITTWFPGSTGLWTVCAAAGLAPRLLEEPERFGRFYEESMRGLLPFHHLLDHVAHGPPWTSSVQLFHFFGKGGAMIWGRVSDYLRIRDDDYGWFRPSAWGLRALEAVGRAFPPFMVMFFVFALVRSRLDVSRAQQARPFRFYFKSVTFRLWNAVRWLPHFLWSAVPRRALPPARE